MHHEFINTRQPDPKLYSVCDIIFACQAVCSHTSWGKVDKLAYLFTGPWHITTKLHSVSYDITFPQKRQRSGTLWTYLHTLQRCYPSNYLTVPTINTANSIKRYPRIRTSRQGSKVLNRQCCLKFQHNTSLRTRALTSAGPH